MSFMDKIDQLIEILLDINARVDERDDAALDLGKYNDDRALNALLSIALDPQGESFIMDVCGESIGEIWVKRNQFDIELYRRMEPSARRELYKCIKEAKPEWIERYQLDVM